MTTTAPYGSWTSPIDAVSLARSGHPVQGGAFVGDSIVFCEMRPAEGGRYGLFRRNADGSTAELLPAPWNARTRVHEYGGGAWAAAPDGSLVFAEFTDQRLHLLPVGSVVPVPLTPEPPEPSGWRYAELSVSDGRVLAVRERHDSGTITRDLVWIPLDGSAASDAGAITSIVGGSHFLAYPRVSPDGGRIAWIAWDHPQMPWDGTRLCVAPLAADGTAGPVTVLAGSTTESVLQPEWASPDELYLISDRTGWWNLYRIAAAGGVPAPLYPDERDYAGPLWQLGSRWYVVLGDGRLLASSTLEIDRLDVIDPGTGQSEPLPLDGFSALSLGQRRDGEVLLLAAGAKHPGGLRRLDLATGSLSTVRESVETLPPAAVLPEAEPMTFTGESGREVHAIVYRPANPDFDAPAGELPPFVAFVHGGPTGRVYPRLDVEAAYFTSRGIGVVDINYGGSTGYGREYRERLRGQWGVVDVQDTIAAVVGLADAGVADRARLAIRGGSAGGWTVLASLTGSDVFACGASYFGVAELVQFAQDTHDFESRYLDGLIGPLPEARQLYDDRAPVNQVANLSTPVLLLQGLDDPIVPPSQAEMFRDAMLAKGIPHAYLAYEGESHGFRRESTIVSAHEAELSFYGQIMGFTPPGVPALQLWRPE